MTNEELVELVDILAAELRGLLTVDDDEGWKYFCLLQLTEPQRDAVGFPRWPESGHPADHAPIIHSVGNLASWSKRGAT